MPIKPGHAFQGDLLWTDEKEKNNGIIRPNTIPYRATHHDVGFAVHGQYEVKPDGSFIKISSSPDLSQLSNPNMFVPDLQVKRGSIRLNPQRDMAVRKSLKLARKALTPKVEEYATSIAGNKKIHKFMQEYLNEVVATTGQRTVKSLRDYVAQPISGQRTSYGYMEKSTQAKMSDAARQKLEKELRDHIDQNKHHIQGLFEHMQHITDAKHHMLDQLAEHHDKFNLTPAPGEEHEGLVSALGIPGVNETLAKLTREGLSGFSARNRRRGVERGFSKEREKPHPNVPFVEQIVKEDMGGGMMTASSGAISGMGYNLGGPAPDDVAVPPLKSRMASKAAKPFRRKIMTKLLGRMNVGREAY